MATLDFEFNRDSLDLFPKDNVSNNGSGSGSKVHFAGVGSDRNSTTSGNSSNQTPGGDRHDVMAKYLYKRCQQAKWLEVSDHLRGTLDGGSLDLGVTIKRSPGSYTSEPLLLNPDIVRAVSALDTPVAFTMASEITSALFQQITPFQRELELDRYGCVLPIVNRVAEITLPNSTVSREAYMCLCRKEKIVLVWGDSVPGILAHGADVETIFVGMVRYTHPPSIYHAILIKYRSGEPQSQNPLVTPGTPALVQLPRALGERVHSAILDFRPLTANDSQLFRVLKKSTLTEVGQALQCSLQRDFPRFLWLLLATTTAKSSARRSMSLRPHWRKRT